MRESSLRQRAKVLVIIYIYIYIYIYMIGQRERMKEERGSESTMGVNILLLGTRQLRVSYSWAEIETGP
jgi:hypothetical protein